MGQTLTHGVYLPDEGERNCYSGLAANWQILDNSVGTIASHTTQIAGKAPLVHTHTKADITDLFNSANTWTGANTYSKALTVEKNSDTNFFFNAKHTAAELGSLPSSDQTLTLAFKDKNDDNLCYARVYYETTGGNSFRIFVRNKYASGAPSTSGTADYAYFGLKINADKSKEGVLRGTFRPYDNNTYDLGSSSYQWNNLYAKNYYYNGTAWGLDKANTWTTDQIIQNASLVLKNTNISQGSSATTGGSAITLIDKNNQNLVSISTRVTSASRTIIELNVRNTYKNGALSNDQGAELIASSWYFGHLWNGTPYYTLTGYCDSDIIPKDNNSKNLGTSTNKWKSFNGINPGALSLPVTALNNTYDISGDITDLTGGNNSITAARTGWIFVKSDNATEISIENTITGMGASDHSAVAATLMVSIPVTSGETLNIIANCTSIDKAYLLPCQGNV